MSKTDKYITYVVLGIAIIGLILSVLIINEKKYYETGDKSLCTVITNGTGCQTVQTSKYASMFGIKNPVYGIFGFSFLAIISLISLKKNMKILRYGTILAGLIAGGLALWFLYVQTFLLSIYCIFCVLVDILSLALLGISIYYIKKELKK